MKDSDEFRQFICHRGSVRPPCSVDIGTKSPGEGKPDGAGQSSCPGQTIHDDTSTRGCGAGRSEKTGPSVGSIEVSKFGVGSGCSECENSSDDSITVSLRGAGLPHR